MSTPPAKKCWKCGLVMAGAICYNKSGMGFLNKIASFFTSGEDTAPAAQRPGRNGLCWCGSGRKYKKCHLEEDEKKLAKKYTASCKT